MASPYPFFCKAHIVSGPSERTQSFPPRGLMPVMQAPVPASCCHIYQTQRVDIFRSWGNLGLSSSGLLLPHLSNTMSWYSQILGKPAWSYAWKLGVSNKSTRFWYPSLAEAWPKWVFCLSDLTSDQKVRLHDLTKPEVSQKSKDVNSEFSMPAAEIYKQWQCPIFLGSRLNF